MSEPTIADMYVEDRTFPPPPDFVGGIPIRFQRTDVLADPDGNELCVYPS